MKFSQVPALGVRACMSSSTPWSLSVLTLSVRSVLPSFLRNFGTPNKRLFDAQSLCPHAPLPTLRPASSRMPTHGSRWRWWLAFSLLSDFHRLPFTS